MLEQGEGVEPLAELIQNQRWREKNCLTRCVVTMNHIRPIVRLAYVDESGDIGRLDGTKNYFSITTDRYNKTPITITGPGAGPEVTAAGVLADVLEIVH
jgi:homoserine dehydrogenase